MPVLELVGVCVSVGVMVGVAVSLAVGDIESEPKPVGDAVGVSEPHGARLISYVGVALGM